MLSTHTGNTTHETLVPLVADKQPLKFQIRESIGHYVTILVRAEKLIGQHEIGMSIAC